MKKIMMRCLLTFIVLFGPWCKTSWGLGAIDILDRVQQRYGEGDFEADFVQESHLKAMGIVDTAKGHLYFGRPGTMRWHYQMPEEYLIITDGDSVWIYRPAENQVMVGRAVDYFGSNKGTDLFTKPGELPKEFILEFAPEEVQEKDCYALRLIPKTKRPNIAELYLFVSKKTFDIAKSVTYNSFGDKTTIRFEGYRFDRGLNSSFFVFEIPSGAEVLQLEGEEGSDQP